MPFLAAIAGLSAALFLAGFVVARRFRVQTEAELARVAAIAPASGADRSLPPLLERFLARTELAPGAGMRSSRIEQVGAMQRQPGGPWRPFSAVQIYAVAEPSFVWKASFRGVEVADRLVGAQGQLEARLLGVFPVIRVAGPDATRAQLLRYLGEIVWVPRAISANPAITWEETGKAEVLGRIQQGGTKAELRFLFDEHGDVVRVAGMRARSVGNRLVETPWSGDFSAYARVGGLRIPTRGAVQWMLDSGPFTYWRAEVIDIRPA